MKIKAIKTETDYNIALDRLKSIFQDDAESPNVDKAEVLSIGIEKY